MGSPSAGLRQKDGPPRKGGGAPPMTSPPMQEMPQYSAYEQDGGFEKSEYYTFKQISTYFIDNACM